MKVIRRTALFIVTRITLIILNVIVLFQYYNNDTDLLLFVTILNVMNLFLCSFRGFSYHILLIIGSIFVYKNFWLSVALGLVFGTIITCIREIVAYIKAVSLITNYVEEE